MAKIDDRKKTCNVTALNSTTQCRCGEIKRVICNLSDGIIAKPGDKWWCGVFVGATHFSNKTVHETENSEECTTTNVPQHVTEESITSFSTTAYGMKEETAAVLNEVEENGTIESLKNTTIQHTNNVEENEHGGSYKKPDITQLALMIAGPFVVFDLGLFMFIYRKKLISYLGGKHVAEQMSSDENAPGDGNINMAAESNNDSFPHCNSAQRERGTMRQPTTAPHKQICGKLNANQQEDVDLDECIDNDPLYNRVKEKATKYAGINSKPQSGKTKGSNDFMFVLSLDEDSSYSSVKNNKNIEEGACGFTLHGDECTLADPLYIDIDSMAEQSATAKKDRQLGKIQHNENPLLRPAVPKEATTTIPFIQL
ncbi:hypothetical protein DPMN_109799 [Dreissena polymorpha]|uniref:Uncharacterized protein n=1 Tax=Dreissena polymorpha TaxID=45954 RepID=A0A9D4QMI5_DREPO|nr:hypothetical protein DPMN_109799 [Dreissena polymorpha]